MSGTSGQKDLAARLKEIDEAEEMIRDLLKHAQVTIAELSKEKQMSKSKLDDPANQYRVKLSKINNILGDHMAYLQNVCVGCSHQGSTFVSQQNIELAQSAEWSLHTDLTLLCEKHFPEDVPDSMQTDQPKEAPESFTQPPHSSSLPPLPAPPVRLAPSGGEAGSPME